MQSDKKAEIHRKTASKFSILQRELEKFYVIYNNTDDKNTQKNIFQEFINEFNVKHNQLITDAPTPGEKEFQEESSKYKKLIEYDK